MISAKELQTMKEIPYGEDAVNLWIALQTVRLDVVFAAKCGKVFHRIISEEYYDRESTESTYVLDCLEGEGYKVTKCIQSDAVSGEDYYCVLISWGELYG